MPNKLTFKELFKREFFMGGIIIAFPAVIELGWLWGIALGFLGGLSFAFVMALIFSNWSQSKDSSRLKVFYKGDEKPSNSNQESGDPL